MPNTFADEILSRRFKARTAEPAPDPTKKESPTVPKRTVEEVVEESFGSGISLQPSESHFEPEVSSSLSSAPLVQPNYVSRALPARFEYDRERRNRMVELERKVIWGAERQLEPKAKRKAWRLNDYRWLYVAETSWAIFSLLVRWPVERFLSLEPIVQGDLAILTVLGIVILCTSPGRSDALQEQSAESQQISIPAKSQETRNKTDTLSRRKPLSGKKQKTRQKNNPPAARDNQL